MKIRQGFVSNSSSSSFVISSDAYDSVFDVALAMIPHRDWGHQDRKLMAKIRKAMGKGGKKNTQTEDPNTSISFPTCNFDTYIVKKGEYYLISTCHNHPFYDVLDGQCMMSDELCKELGIHELCMESLVSVVKDLDSFWYPDFDMYANPLSSSDFDGDWYCKKHFHDLVKLVGSTEKVCLACVKKGKKNYES
jgi:hypothetical protein